MRNAVLFAAAIVLIIGTGIFVSVVECKAMTEEMLVKRPKHPLNCTANDDPNAIVVRGGCILSCDRPECLFSDLTQLERCVCRPGYVFEHSVGEFGAGKCIKLEECPPSDKKRPNHPSCTDPNAVEKCVRGGYRCIPSCELSERASYCISPEVACGLCVCRDGYKFEHRSGKGKCIEANKCPPKKEKKLPQWSQCPDPNAARDSTSCPASCEDPKPECMDPGFLYPPACVCRAGYVYDKFSVNSKCIKLEDCPPKEKEMPKILPD